MNLWNHKNQYGRYNMAEVIALHEFYLECPSCGNDSWLIEYNSWKRDEVLGITCSSCFYYFENKEVPQ